MQFSFHLPAIDTAFAMSLSARLLQRELADVLSDDEFSSRLRVALIGDDVHLWAVTLRASSGPWRGALAHLHLTFPSDYPLSPPRVQLVTTLPGNHPNVFNSYICLDMLRKDSGYAYQGWSPAYRASSVIMQLAGFLIDDESIGQGYGEAIQRGPSTSDLWGRVANSSGSAATAIDASNESAVARIRTCLCCMHDLPPELPPAAAPDPAPATFPGHGGGLSTSSSAAAQAGAAELPGSDILRDMPVDCLRRVLAAVKEPQDLLKLQRAMAPPGALLPSAPGGSGGTPGVAATAVAAGGNWTLWRCVLDALQRQSLRCYVVRDAEETAEEEWGELLGLGKFLYLWQPYSFRLGFITCYTSVNTNGAQTMP